MKNKLNDTMANQLLPLPREVGPQDAAAKALAFFVHEKLKLEAAGQASGKPNGKS